MLFVLLVIVVLAIEFGPWAVKQMRLGEQRQQVAVLARQLSATSVADRSTTVMRDGLTVTICFEDHGSTTSRPKTTLIVPLPPGVPFVMHVREAGWRDRAKVERGELVDIEIGEPAFDERYVIEAAPAELVRRVLTPQFAKPLHAFPFFELRTVGQSLQLEVWTHEWQPSRIEALMATLTTISNGVRQAAIELEAPAPAAQAGGPFRPVPSDLAIRRAALKRVDEVAVVNASLASQRVDRVVKSFFLVALGVLAYLMIR